MKRRFFAYLSLAWISPATLSVPPATATEGSDPLPALLAQLTLDQSTAVRMGQAYLAVAEHGRLAATEARLGRARGEGVAGLRQAIAALVRADLARADTILVDGWVLARAEAETLALISIERTRSC